MRFLIAMLHLDSPTRGCRYKQGLSLSLSLSNVSLHDIEILQVLEALLFSTLSMIFTSSYCIRPFNVLTSRPILMTEAQYLILEWCNKSYFKRLILILLQVYKHVDPIDHTLHYSRLIVRWGDFAQ